MVNKVFDVSAEFDTCRQVIVESGVTRPYLDLILGRSVPNPHTPIFRDPRYTWLTLLSTYGRCFGKCLSADCKDVAAERDLLCALVARALPFAVPNKKGTPTRIIRLLALVWHTYGAVESWREDRTVMLTHMILRCRQIPKFSCRTIAETAAVAIFPPPQAFLAHFARFVPILCAVKQI